MQSAEVNLSESQMEFSSNIACRQNSAMVEQLGAKNAPPSELSKQTFFDLYISFLSLALFLNPPSVGHI